MTQHDDFDPLIAPARGRAGSEAVRTYETIKRHALTEMAGVLSGFWGSIEEQVRLAALSGPDYSANQDDRVAIAALTQRAPALGDRKRGVAGTCVSVRVAPGGRGIIKKEKR